MSKRDEAYERGDTIYRGASCDVCAGVLRYASSGACVRCQKARVDRKRDMQRAKREAALAARGT